MISIIVPYFNSENYLLRLITSIQNQNYSNYECILVDDGSSDNSFSHAEEIISQDKRFTNKRRPSQYAKGGRGAKNYGYTKSKGSYIVFFDADDVMLPNYLSSRINFLQNHLSKDAVISDFFWKVKEGEVSKRIFSYKTDLFNNFKSNILKSSFWINYMDYRFYFPPGNAMYRRAFIENKPMWDESTSIGEDHEYHARLFLNGLDLGIIEQPTFDYMANPNSMIATSEAIQPLLSRSYGKYLVIKHILLYLGHRPELIHKEMICQAKILRRIVACKDSSKSKTAAVKIMTTRIKELMLLIPYSSFYTKIILLLMNLLIQFQLRFGKGFSFYTFLIKDKNPTIDNVYFSIK